jgi:ribonuclease BN (tRNA processing enzyme)
MVRRNKVAIKQIGNGGAFDYKQTNSSFIVKNNNNYILIDCGFSVFAKVREMDDDTNDEFSLEYLTDIYITHLDDDHVGSLKALLYYMFFIKGKKVKIHVSVDIHEEMNTFLGSVKNTATAGLFIINPYGKLITDKNTYINGLIAISTPTDHHTNCGGIILIGNDYKKSNAIFISGDTRATKELNKILSSLIKSFKNKLLLFHDYSNWNNKNNVHAYEDNINEKYDSMVKDNIIKYHTGEEFSEEWRTVQ